MCSDLLELLAVIRTELLDPQWGQLRSGVIKPGEGDTPRIIAEKIGRALQSIVSSDIPVLQKSRA
jgi:hypothetical protein